MQKMGNFIFHLVTLPLFNIQVTKTTAEFTSEGDEPSHAWELA